MKTVIVGLLILCALVGYAALYRSHRLAQTTPATTADESRVTTVLSVAETRP